MDILNHHLLLDFRVCIAFEKLTNVKQIQHLHILL